MFQLGSLVVLCGLLIGTSGSLFDIFQNPELDVESVWSEINYRIRYALETMDLDMLADYLSKRGIELKIKDLRILNLNHEVSPNGDEVTLKMPMALNASLSLPARDLTTDVSISMEAITSFAIEKDPKTGRRVLNMQRCSLNTDNTSISLLNRKSNFVNLALDSALYLIKRGLTLPVRRQLCPVLQLIISNTFHPDEISNPQTAIST
ncbi:neonatal submandibular gland protein B [Rattus norvegicus]|uniref:Neonatal submandibular gland proacinar cell protein n=2 Tax=Rattus norvegicus TaxID=10116 RepID=F7FD74_RAT|nr:BPI fold containing family A, member 2F precursor [Rattus norvegicus]AAC12783.1 neonatal submandibular gland proacinar cell protein precursor [Rattus norvegicus]EDL85981.1 neonatal submandibular gland protein B [Rattus norvegicus]|eukprot:NP_542953.1 BPI fold containing family A, member 2F precursor [Rattus norvegicus]